MDLDLAGRVALVTGSSAGLGFAIASALVREGSDVILNGRDERRLAEARVEMGAVDAIAGDVSSEAGASQIAGLVADRFRRLDVLVCNVGSGRSLPVLEETDAEWERMMRINLLAATGMVKACRSLLARKGGTVVCISSICGIEALGCPLAYGAAKAALNAYVRSSARSLARDGIRINALAPGNILFPGSVWETKIAENADAVNDMLRREVAIARLGRADEIADWATFLASPRSSFATGQIYIVDGGQVRS